MTEEMDAAMVATKVAESGMVGEPTAAGEVGRSRR